MEYMGALAGCLAVVCAPRQGLAQAAPDAIVDVRTGAHPTRDAALAPGAVVLFADALDVDADGREDQLLTVRAPPGVGTPGGGLRTSLVVARNTTAGWSAELVVRDADQEGDQVSGWAEPIRVGQRLVLVYAAESGGDAARSGELRFLADRRGQLGDLGAVRGAPGEFLSARASSDGAIVVFGSRGRHRVVRLDANRVSAGPWRSGSPPPVLAPARTTSAPHAPCVLDPPTALTVTVEQGITREVVRVPAHTPVDLVGLGARLRLGSRAAGNAWLFRVRTASRPHDGYALVSERDFARACGVAGAR